jgi:hypothetical protein
MAIDGAIDVIDAINGNSFRRRGAERPKIFDSSSSRPLQNITTSYGYWPPKLCRFQ